jgi:hypothetical protein
LVQWVLERPLETPTSSFPQRLISPNLSDAAEIGVDFDDAWGEEADTALARAADLVAAGRTAIRLVGELSSESLRDRLAFGERLRNALVVRVEVLAADELLAEAADGLLAGRTDLVVVATPDIACTSGTDTPRDALTRS